MHVTHAGGDRVKTDHKENVFKCERCKNMYPEENYVVKHEIRNIEFWFCLNCDAWIQDKSNVFNNEWTLLDKNGDLR